MIVPIQYKSVIVHPGNVKVKDDYCGMATKNEHLALLSYYFNHETHGEMSIRIQGSHVQLNHQSQSIPLTLNQKVAYDYRSPYGTLSLHTYLKKLTVAPGRVDIIYELYDGDYLMSSCYLRIREATS